MIMHAQVVVNAQFEDRIRARICPGDSLKRARLFDMNEKWLPVNGFKGVCGELREYSRSPEPPNPFDTLPGWLAGWLVGSLAG